MRDSRAQTILTRYASTAHTHHTTLPNTYMRFWLHTFLWGVLFYTYDIGYQLGNYKSVNDAAAFSFTSSTNPSGDECLDISTAYADG